MLLTPDRGTAQEAPEALLDVADAYFRQGNYDASATEYLRFLFFAPKHPAGYYAYFRLGLAEQHLGRYEQAVTAFRQASRLVARPEDRRHVSFRLALAYLSAQEFERAKLELLTLALSNQDSVLATQASIVVGIAYAFQSQWTQAGDLFRRASGLQEGNEPFQEQMAEATALVDRLVEAPVRKSPAAAKWASTFLPGSGQIYAGHPVNGLTALAINAGTSYLLYRALATGSYLDAVLTASSLWWRYYQGNRLHAEAFAIQANQQHLIDLENRLYAALQAAGRLLPATDYGMERPERAGAGGE